MTPACQVLVFRGCLLSSELRPPPHPTPPHPICALTRCKKRDIWKLLELSRRPGPCPVALHKAGGLRLGFPCSPCSLPSAYFLWVCGEEDHGLLFLAPSDGPAVGTRGCSPAAGAEGSHVGQARSFQPGAGVSTPSFPGPSATKVAGLTPSPVGLLLFPVSLLLRSSPD